MRSLRFCREAPGSEGCRHTAIGPTKKRRHVSIRPSRHGGFIVGRRDEGRRALASKHHFGLVMAIFHMKPKKRAVFSILSVDGAAVFRRDRGIYKAKRTPGGTWRERNRGRWLVI